MNVNSAYAKAMLAEHAAFEDHVKKMRRGDRRGAKDALDRMNRAQAERQAAFETRHLPAK